MGFGFGRLPGLPAGLTQQDFEALLAAAPPGASTMGRPGPFGFGPLTAPPGAPMGLPGAPGDETMARPTFPGSGDQDEAPRGPENAIPAPGSVLGYGPHADPSARPIGSPPQARPLSFGALPLSADMLSGAPAAPAVTGPEFGRRFDASPPGEGYGLGASQADALRAGLTRPAAPAADMPAPDAIPAAGGAPAPSFAVPTPAPRPLGFGALPVPPAAAPQAAQAPAASAPAPAAPAVPAPALAAGDGGGFLSRLGDPKVYNMLLGIGQGLLTTKGFGPGIAAGTAYASKLNKDQSVSDLAQAEYGLKARKASQEATGNNITYQRLVEKGVPAADAQAAIAAAMAGHGEALSNFLNNNFRKVPDAPAGFTYGPDGKTMARIPGGPQDPSVKREESQATAEGTAAGKPDDPFNLSPGQTRYDADGKAIVSAPPQKPEGFDAEMKLRNEFNKNLGSFQDVHDGYSRVIAATKQRETDPNAKSPASDISLVFGYMKMLDPGSVVREGEYATAKNATGIPVQVQNAYNKALSGEFLSDTQRRDFLGQAAELYGAARNGAEGVADRYRGLASHYGVDPDRSVYLPTKPVPPVLGGQTGSIPAGAIQMLKRDPSMRGQFDAKYGAGAADSALGGR